MRTRFGSVLHRFAHDTRGAATLEFVVLIPFLMIIVFMFAEIGILTGRTVLLKRGVDIAARDIRIKNAPINVQEFRNTACANAFLINSCYQELIVNVTPINVAAQTDPFSSVACRNRVDPTLTPATSYNPGGDGDIMVITACLIVDPVFPGAGIMSLPATGLTWADGQGYAIIVKSAFMVECDDQDNCV